MAEYVADSVIDAAITELATATRMDLVSDASTPTDLTNTLGNVTLTAGVGGGDYTIETDAPGRRLQVAAQNIASATGTGTGRHVVISLGGTILGAAPCADVAAVTGQPVNVNSNYFRPFAQAV